MMASNYIGLKHLRRLIPEYLLSRCHWWRSIAGINDFTIKDLDRIFEEICNHVNIDEIEKLWERMRPIYEQDPECAAKYPNYEYWFRLNIVRAVRLGLNQYNGIKRVLDIGCGSGYFMAVCKHYGHYVVGLDVNNKLLNDIESEVFDKMLKALYCEKQEAKIEPFEPLPVKEKFDLIVAFLVCFNNHKCNNEWSCAEWKYFVEDTINHLNEGGRLWLELNANPLRYERRVWYDQSTFDYFRSIGSVKDNIVIIRKQNRALPT